MRLARHGIYKNHGMKSLFMESDRNRIQYAQRQAGPRIVIEVTAVRAQESSYHYELQLTPEEIIRCILTLPPSAIHEAIKKVAGQFNLTAAVPELVKQLTAGAIAAPRPTANDEDEELEQDVENDEDDDDEDA